MKSSRWLAVLWFALIVGVWIARGLPWNLDEYDQAKQAYTSYEMIGRDAWWYQHTPRQDSATKPPLVGWISAGLYKISGNWDAAWRLPSLLAAIGTLILLWQGGLKVAGIGGAYLATAAFAWNLLAIRLATMVRTDMVLAFFIFASGWLIWRRLQNDEKWTVRGTLWLTLLLTAATMTKGPIYHAFLLPGLVAWLIFAEPQENKSRIVAGYFVASLASLLPFLLWTWLRMRQDPAFYDQVVVKEFLGRFTVGAKAVHNNQTWYFYLPHLLTKTAPWSLLFLAALVLKRMQLDWKKNSATLWLICWTLGGVIAMSLVPSKRVDRIFPVIPAAALTLAALLPVLRARFSPRLLVTLGALAVAGYGGYTIFVVREGYRHEFDRLVKFGSQVRQLCATNHWNYALVEGRDEGLLMYAGKMSFTELKTTATQLKNGTLQAAVVDSSDLKKLTKNTGELHSILEIAHPTDTDYSYYLVQPVR
ncbi:MAG: glycosyltransferase family 39 protein [Chthoniobacterales bacterium]